MNTQTTTTKPWEVIGQEEKRYFKKDCVNVRKRLPGVEPRWLWVAKSKESWGECVVGAVWGLGVSFFWGKRSWEGKRSWGKRSWPVLRPGHRVVLWVQDRLLSELRDQGLQTAWERDREVSQRVGPGLLGDQKFTHQVFVSCAYSYLSTPNICIF